MKTIIFSKQCDQDIELCPLWLHWYTKVFKADQIVITPVKTKLSRIDLVTAFFESYQIPVIPIELSDWKEEEIWEKQKLLLQPFLPKQDPYLVLSADTDQFFEPHGGLAKKTAMVYQRVHVTAQQTPTVETADCCGFDCFLSFDLIGGYINDLETAPIFLTGHYVGSVSQSIRQNMRYEFHLTLRGFEHFRRKIAGLSIEDDGSKVSDAWKAWRAAYDSAGDDGLREQYTRLEKDIADYVHRPDLTELYRTYINRKPLPDIHRANSFPYPSSVGALSVAERSKNSTIDLISFNTPRGEASQTNEIFEKQKYALPLQLNPGASWEVIDIGAHVGLFSMLILSHNPKAHLNIIEPIREHFDLLEKNLRRWSKNIALYPFALSDHDGFSYIYRHLRDSSAGSLHCTPDHDSLAPLLAPVRDAGVFFDTLNLERVDILKINAPGSELSILKSLGQRLERIAYLLVRFGSSEGQQSIAQLLPGFVEYAESSYGIAKYRNTALSN